MTATASSAFELADRASPALRGIRLEATRTRDALKGTAAAADKIGSPQQLQRLDRLNSRMDSVGTRSEGMSARVKRAVSGMQDSITKSTLDATAHLLSLEDGLDTIGRKRATPRVALEGYADTTAELASLNRQIDVLSRKTARPRISLAGAAASGGGAAAGGGGRAGKSGASKAFSFFANNPLISTAVPAAILLSGAVPPLVGSAVGAGLGAGALGVAGAGTLGAGIAGIVAVAKPAEASVKALNTAEKAYTLQVDLHGKASKQAQAAQQKLNLAIKAAPAGTTRFLHELNGLDATWKKVTKPGQASLLGAAGNITGDVRRAAPFLGRQANLVSASVGSQGSRLGGFITSPQELQVVETLAHAFANDLGGAEQTAEHLLGTLGNIAVASTPFFHQAVEFVDQWTGGWERSTSDITATRRTIGGYFNDLKAWGRLGGATFDLIRDLVMPGQVQGDSLVADLTRQLDKWDTWLRLNPGRLRSFFQEGIDGTKSLASLLGTVATDLNQVAQILLPVLSRFASLANIAGGAGILLPTVLRLGLGKAMGGSATGGLGGVVFGGGSKSSASSGGLLGVVRSGGTQAAGSTAALAAEESRSGTQFHPLVGPGVTYNASQGALGELPQGIAGADAAATGRLAALRGGVAGAGASLARFGAPVLAISAAESAATTPGNLGERIQAAVSGASFGIIPAPVTSAQARQQGQAHANSVIQSLHTPTTASSAQKQIADLQKKQAAAASRSKVDAGHGLFGGTGFGGFFQPGYGGDKGPTATAAKSNAAAVLQYAAAIKQLRTEEAELSRQQSQAHGSALGESFEQAFNILSPSKGPAAALKQTLAGVVKDVGELKPAGAKALTEATLEWARSIAQGNPKLQAIVKSMTSGIQSQFTTMGKKVQIVNGQVLTGSTTEWKSIAAALTTPAEQAQEEVSKSFTLIQQQALGSLTAMGFSPSQAKQILQGVSAGGAAAVGAQQNVGAAQSGVAASSLTTSGSYAPGAKNNLHARGGRLPGRGLRDTVPLSDGGWGAPGELILNRHTEADADRDRAPGAPTLAQRVRGERRRHSDQMRATGGRVGGFTAAPGTNYSVGEEPTIASRLNALGHALGISLTGVSGYRSPAHSVAVGGFSDDPHTKGDASDTPGVEGVSESTLAKYGLTRPFAGASEADHIQLLGSVAGAAGAAGAAATLGAMSARASSVSLKAPGSRLGGAPGALSARASSIYASALSNVINSRTGGGATSTGLVSGVGGSSSANQALGRQMMLAAGFPSSEWPALRQLWTEESNWSDTAMNNPRLGWLAPGNASGIPQADGHGQVYPKGQARPQIRWGLGYIKSTYGTPSKALAFENSHTPHWYGAGGSGTARRPTLIGIGDNHGARGEDFTVKPTKLGPPSKRAGALGSGTGGMGSVTIEKIIVTNNRPGDIKQQIKDEVSAAFSELAYELDHGVNADEDALIR